MTERRAHRPIWQQTWLWVVVVTGVGAGFLFWVMRPPPPPTMPAEEEARAAVAFELPLPDDPSVAVTTFGSETDALPGADIAREVVAELARDPDLFVIHFDSSARFGAATPVRDVAAALGVRYVVQGALTLRRDTVRFSGSVTDAVSVEDVQAMAPSVMRHRIIPNFKAQAEGLSSLDIIARLMEEIQPPAEDNAAA